MDFRGDANHLLQKYNEIVAYHAQLQQERKTFKRLFDRAPTPDFLTNGDGIILQANQAAGQLLGLAADAWMERSLLDFIAPEMIAVVQATLQQLQQAGGNAQLNVRLWRESTQNSPDHASPSSDPGSWDAGAVVFHLDADLDCVTHDGRMIRWQAHDVSHYRQWTNEQQQQLELAQLSADMIQQIHQSLDPKAVLHNAVTEVQRVLNVDRVVIYRVDGEQGIAIAEAVESGWRSLLGQSIIPNLDASNCIGNEPAWCRKDGSVVFSSVDGLSSPSQLTECFHCHHIRAMVTVPVIDESKVLGLLAVHQCGRERIWQWWEIELLQRLADQLAIALCHSTMYQQVQQTSATLEQDLHQRNEQMQRILKYESMLKRITNRVRDSLNQDQILQAAVQELTVGLEIAGCNAALYDLDQNTSTILYEYTSSIPAFYGKVARMEDAPEIYHQLKAGHSFQFCSLYPNPVRGAVAMLACPIFVDPQSAEGMEQTVLGDLWLIHEKDYVFNLSEIELVQQVADQCAIAIRQARLYRAAKTQVEELEHLNQLKDQFLSTVSHELRTPIANLKMAIHMLELSNSPEKQAQYIKILKDELARESDFINDLLDLQRLEQSRAQLSLEVIDVKNWLPELVRPFQSRLHSYQQNFVLHCVPEVQWLRSDLSSLGRILVELLHNACKYTARESTIELSVAPSESTFAHVPHLVFTLRNEAEIPANELPHIFEKFYRVTQLDRYKHGGTGLGLALVKKLAEELGGTISAASQDGWTTFTLTVPSYPVEQSEDSFTTASSTDASSTNTSTDDQAV
ncbi:MAG: GAF domain-containing protein [Cyanobacteria bacterium J06638_22]